MSMEEVKLSSKGQLVIPKYIREALGLKPGVAVLVGLHENKIVILPKPEDPIKALEEAGKKVSLRGARKEIKGE